MTETVAPTSADDEPYDVLTRCLHWTTAALVLTLYVLYLFWEQAPKGHVQHLLIVSHLSLGAALTIVLLGRVAWRSSPRSSRLPHAGFQGSVAHGLHLLLYVLLFAQVLFGWNFRWAQGQPMSVFGLAIPSPFAYPAQARHFLAALHYWTGTTIVVLAGLHAAAALYHHFVLRDGVLLRMATGGLRQTGR